MKGMSRGAVYFYKSESFERETVVIPQRGTRFENSKIIRSEKEGVNMKYRVTGWDMQMNDVKKVVDTMDDAIEVALTLLGGSARIRPITK